MNTALTDVGPRASLVLLCCKFTRRLPENPLSLFWYPVSAAVAGDVCTCAVKANWLMEKPVLLHTGVCFFLFFFALTIFGIINTWERMNPVYYRRTKMRRLTLAPSFLCPAASSLPPSLPPSLATHLPPLPANALLSLWQKDCWNPFEQPINCHAGWSAMLLTSIPLAARHVTWVPAHHAAIYRSKKKQLAAWMIYTAAELVFMMFPLLAKEEINPGIYWHTSGHG